MDAQSRGQHDSLTPCDGVAVSNAPSPYLAVSTADCRRSGALSQRLDRNRGRGRLVVPVVAAGLLAALLAVWLAQSRPSGPAASQHTVSGVAREIRRLALHRSSTPGLEDGGAIGTWWIFASSVDDMTNTFHDFRLRAGSGGRSGAGLQLAARTAILIIDSDANTVSFDLRDVVVLSLPGKDGGAADGGLVKLESFLLGPATYRRNIRPDPVPRFQPPASSRLAGVADQTTAAQRHIEER
jgi:hypothetical protein